MAREHQILRQELEAAVRHHVPQDESAAAATSAALAMLDELLDRAEEISMAAMLRLESQAGASRPA